MSHSSCLWMHAHTHTLHIHTHTDTHTHTHIHMHTHAHTHTHTHTHARTHTHTCTHIFCFTSYCTCVLAQDLVMNEDTSDNQLLLSFLTDTSDTSQFTPHSRAGVCVCVCVCVRVRVLEFCTLQFRMQCVCAQLGAVQRGR